MRSWFIHGIRVAMLAGIVAFIHWEHRERALASATATLETVDGQLLESIYGAGTMIGAPHSALKARYVVDASGTAQGYVLQTSPEGDGAIGFSGPSNVLVAFDGNDKIIGLRLLSSDDTREHAEMVASSSTFRNSFQGARWEEAPNQPVDAVSGATLTSLAAAEAVVARLGGQRPSFPGFPHEPTLADLKRVFPTLAERVAAVNKDDKANRLPFYHLRDASGQLVGRLLRSTPAADQIVGYQGPTEVWLLLDAVSPTVTGMGVGPSYDNEPYVDYVREDAYFRSLFNDLTISELAKLDLQESQVEGVSGATMTSLGVAESVVATAKRELARGAASRSLKATPPLWSTWRWMDVVACSIIVVGATIGMTRLRGRRRLLRLYQLGLIAFLGFAHGDLLSQAMFVGWAQHGVPWQRAPSLVLLTVAALALPIATGRNIYCSHLCAHGAAQQWLRRVSPWRWRMPPALSRSLKALPAILLLWVVWVAMTGRPFGLVDIEPFDAWVFWIAGVPTITIAIVGLAWSTVTPMAYCRYGCPTGALLGFVRKHGRSDRWGRRDWLALTLLLLALTVRGL